MKIILLLSLSALTCGAQIQLINVGTNSGDPTAERINRNSWIKLNNNDLLLLSIANRADSNAALPVAASRLPDNVVYQGGLTTLLASNPFVFSGGSNYLGVFTNVFSVTATAGAGLYFTNFMSLDGGATWVNFYRTNLYSYPITTNYGTNYFGTNYYAYTNYTTNVAYSGVQLAVLSGPTATGSVTVAALAHQELGGRLNELAGQFIDFNNSTIVGAVTTNLQFTFGSTRTNTLCFSNGILMQVTTP